MATSAGDAAADLETRLRAFYAEHNPENADKIPEIVRQYAGREQKLWAKLHKKYGITATSTASTASSGDSSKPVKHKMQSSEKPAVYDAAFKAYPLKLGSDSDPLDLRSSAFDTLQALKTGDKAVALLVQGTFPLDNIQKCRHLLPASDQYYQKRVATVKAPTAKAGATALAAAKAKAESENKPASSSSLFDRLADTYLEGPFTVLRRCFLERKRVLVVIRRVNSVRGTCTGFLKAFDKHMNLLLMDVTEVSIAHETHERQLRDMRSGALPPSAGMFSVADPRRNRRFTQQTFAKQLFVRGDNVVMVCDEEERRQRQQQQQRRQYSQHQRRESKSRAAPARPVSRA